MQKTAMVESGQFLIPLQHIVWPELLGPWAAHQERHCPPRSAFPFPFPSQRHSYFTTLVRVSLVHSSFRKPISLARIVFLHRNTFMLLSRQRRFERLSLQQAQQDKSSRQPSKSPNSKGRPGFRFRVHSVSHCCPFIHDNRNYLVACQSTVF